MKKDYLKISKTKKFGVYKETIRFFNVKNNLEIINNKISQKINNQNDLFTFCIDGKINLKVYEKRICLNTHKLFYINQKHVKFIEISGICAMRKAKYFEV